MTATANPRPLRLADRVLQLGKDNYTFGLGATGEPLAEAADGHQFKLGTTGAPLGKRAAAPFLQQLAGLAHDAELGAISRAPLEQALTVMRTLAARGPTLTPPPITDAPRPSKGGDFTDIGVAARVCTEHGADLRYCIESGHWHVYREGRWLQDDLEVVSRVEDTVLTLVSQNPTEPKAAMLKSQQRLESVVRNLRHKPGIKISINEFDADPMLLNALNGTVDLRTGELRPHEKGELHTKSVAAEFHPEATCPTWLWFLSVVCGADPELVTYLQRALGYSLTGLTTAQCFFFVFGTGQNGKTTLFELIRKLLGGYAVSIDARVVLASGESDHPTAKADLLGARFVVASEPNAGAIWNEGLVKSLTGGDQLRARRMGQDFFRFGPTHTLWFAGNHQPTLTSVEKAMRRRLRLVPFSAQITDDRRDDDLPDKLWEEREGILAWLVEGCRAWQAQSLGSATAIEAATDAYFAEQDRVARFLLETFTTGSPDDRRYWTESTTVFARWQQWCLGEGVQAKDPSWLNRQLAERGFPCAAKTENRRRHILGLRVLSPPAALPLPPDALL